MFTYTYLTQKPDNGALKAIPNLSYDEKTSCLTITTALSKVEVYNLLKKANIKFINQERNFHFEIDCPSCGNKVEAKLNANSNIEMAQYLFTEKKLTVLSKLEFEEIEKLCKAVEPDCAIFKSVYAIYNFKASIDCPLCAKEVEETLKKNPNVKDCSFDYLNKRLNIETSLNEDEARSLLLKSSDEIVLLEDKATNSYTFTAKKLTSDNIKALNQAFANTCQINLKKKQITIATYLTEDEIKEFIKRADSTISFINEEEAQEKKETIITWSRITLSVLSIIFAKLLDLEYLALIGYVLSGYDVLFKAFKNIIKGKAFDENFLMSIATIGALFLKSFEEAAAVMVLYQIGEALQDRSINKSRKSITELMNLKAELTSVKEGDKFVEKPTSQVEIGSTILVKTGEKIPLDGKVVKGFSDVNYSALTGESVPVSIKERDEVLSGGINGEGTLEVITTTNYEGSTVKKIIDLIESAKSKKTKSENFITVFSKYYTPLVCLLAVLVITLPPLVGLGSFSTWLYRGLMLLVISCPCALVISIPLSYFSATGAFAKRGILIKNSTVIQNLATLKTIAFDKTGTLTKGEFKIVKLESTLSKEEAITIASSLEMGSTHPIAKAIRKECKAQLKMVDNLSELSGKGVKGSIEGVNYSFGNAKLLDKEIENNTSYTVCYLLKEREVVATFYLGDELKEDAKESITSLHKMGLTKLVMISGDKEKVAQSVSQELGLDEYHANLLPDEKLKMFESLIEEKVTNAYIGDGINDSPTLSRADIGISMGSLGSDAAIEASDMVIMKDDLSKLPQAIKLARHTQTIVKENIYFSIIIKLLIMILAILGFANMWLAIFADVGVSLLATFNAMRTLFMKK